MNKKRVLIINRKPPYGTANAREALDVALTCAIFEMPVSMLFLGDGLYQLLKNQSPELIKQKKHEAMISSLPMYDIDQLYVTENDLQARGLTSDDLTLPVAVLADSDLPELIAKQDRVMTF